MDTIVSTPLQPKVTTGPLPSSAKVYVSPEAAPDIRVPLREITLSSAAEPPVRVYDTTGPYSDSSVTIDVRKGLARTRGSDDALSSISRRGTRRSGAESGVT